MKRSSGDTNFTFVNYAGPMLPQDPKVRRLIRKSAMRDVAIIRRQAGKYGKHNLLQYPLSLEPEQLIKALPTKDDNPLEITLSRHNQRTSSVEDDYLKAATLNRSRSLAAVTAPYTSIPCDPMLCPDFATISRDFPLLANAVPLMGLRLGVASISHLSSKHCWNVQPHLGSRNLLNFIPSRYGHASSLSHATDCVVAKLRLMMRPPESWGLKGEAIVLFHYVKALRSLQEDLDDEMMRMTPETLCATELLSIFEMLDGNRQPNSWIRHAGGAARLMEVRGPHRFKTEFEMALFMAHVGPTVMEAFLGNTACFLASDAWRQVLRSAIYSDQSCTETNDLIFGLWGLLVRGPQLFRETTDIVMSSDPVPDDVIDELIERLQYCRQILLQWQYQEQLEQTGVEGQGGFVFPTLSFSPTPPSLGCVAHLALRGTYTLCFILKSRLLVALAPKRFWPLEVECQEIAVRIMEIGRDADRSESGRAVWSLFMSQSTWMAKGILETKELWGDGWQEGERDGPIERWKFEEWCRNIGRKFVA